MDGFSHALLWLYHLWLAQREGNEVTIENLINASPQPFAIDIGEMLQKLSELQFIRKTEDGHYLLSCDLTQVTFFELMHQLPYPLPHASLLISNASPIAARWHKQFKHAEQELEHTFAMNLHELFTVGQEGSVLKKPA